MWSLEDTHANEALRMLERDRRFSFEMAMIARDHGDMRQYVRLFLDPALWVSIERNNTWSTVAARIARAAENAGAVEREREARRLLVKGTAGVAGSALSDADLTFYHKRYGVCPCCPICEDSSEVEFVTVRAQTYYWYCHYCNVELLRYLDEDDVELLRYLDEDEVRVVNCSECDAGCDRCRLEPRVTEED